MRNALLAWNLHVLTLAPGEFFNWVQIKSYRFGISLHVQHAVFAKIYAPIRPLK